MAYLALGPVSVAVYAALNVAGLQALVSSRIYDGVPHVPTFPFVLYDVILANEALVRFLAEALGLPRASVTLVGGLSSRSKAVQVAGLAPAEVARRLGLPAG